MSGLSLSGRLSREAATLTFGFLFALVLGAFPAASQAQGMVIQEYALDSGGGGTNPSGEATLAHYSTDYLLYDSIGTVYQSNIGVIPSGTAVWAGYPSEDLVGTDFDEAIPPLGRVRLALRLDPPSAPPGGTTTLVLSGTPDAGTSIGGIVLAVKLPKALTPNLDALLVLPIGALGSVNWVAVNPSDADPSPVLLMGVGKNDGIAGGEWLRLPITVASDAVVSSKLTLHAISGSGTDDTGTQQAALDLTGVSAELTVGSSTPLPPLVIAPSEVTLKAGQSQEFKLTPEVAVTWSVQGEGTIAPDGTFTAPVYMAAESRAIVTATAADGSGRTATAAVTLLPSLTIDPATRTLKAGEEVTFKTNFPASFSVEGGDPNGTVDANGKYLAPAAITEDRTVKVTATASDSSLRTATATVSLLATLQVRPSAVSLSPGKTQQFAAAPEMPVTWSLSGPGTLSENGLYTAPETFEAGQTATVTATSKDGTERTAIATVTLTLLSPLVIAPSEVTLKGGQSQEFKLTPEVAVTWTVQGEGTINTSGFYTAPLSVKTVRVVTVVADDGTGRVGTAKVNLSPDLLIGDATGDGLVNVADAVKILRAAAKIDTLTPEQFTAADVNRDGRVNVADAVKLLRIVAKLDPPLS